MKFEIVNHGYDHSQYFQGCGCSYTEYDSVVTGAGMNAREAYDDALEQIAMMESSGFVEKFPSRPRGINARDKVPARMQREEENEMYYYVSIRYTAPKH